MHCSNSRETAETNNRTLCPSRINYSRSKDKSEHLRFKIIVWCGSRNLCILGQHVGGGVGVRVFWDTMWVRSRNLCILGHHVGGGVGVRVFWDTMWVRSRDLCILGHHVG